MRVITDIWHQLVRRRLWPLALLLVAALVAVPLVLAKEPEVKSEPPLPIGAAGAANADVSLATDPIVTLAEDADRDPRAKVLGDKHDIFMPTAKVVKAKKPDAAAETGTGASTGASDDGSGSTDAGSGGTDATPAAPAPATPATPAPKKYPLYSLLVKFDDGGESVKRHLLRDTALPSAEAPLIIYLGLSDDHQSAVFMLDSTVTAQGDGECHPSPESCETVQMKAGETEFFDIVDESGAAGGGFQLDLIEINKGQTTSTAKAAGSTKRARVAKASSVGTPLRSGIGGERPRRLGLVTRTG